MHLAGCQFTCPGQPNVNIVWGYSTSTPRAVHFHVSFKHSWGRNIKTETCFKPASREKMQRPLVENDRHWATWSCEGGHNLDTYNASIVPRLLMHSQHTLALSVSFLRCNTWQCPCSKRCQVDSCIPSAEPVKWSSLYLSWIKQLQSNTVPLTAASVLSFNMLTVR